MGRLEKRALLSVLWMFVLLNFIFHDLHEIVKAEFLEDALNGIYGGPEVTKQCSSSEASLLRYRSR